MNKYPSKIQKAISIVIIGISLLMIVDFILPGQVIEDKVERLARTHESYNNAGGGFHYSFKVVTENQVFNISEEFARKIRQGTPIVYSESIIFSKVNWYKLSMNDSNSYYILRILLGLMLPLATIVSIFLAYNYFPKLETLVFIFQVLVLVDLFFML